MICNKTITFSLLILSIVFSCKEEDQLTYKNTSAPIEERVNDLLSRMVQEEKHWQLFIIPGDLSDGKQKYKQGVFRLQVATIGQSGNETEQLLDYSGGVAAKETTELINDIQRYFIEETRLGIPLIPVDEILHGLVRVEATVFQHPIGLSATWDTSLMKNVANVIAMETKTRDIRHILSPVLNIERDACWGRTEETHGEAPFLAIQKSLAYIFQFEKTGVLTIPKHFIANLRDGGRDNYLIHYKETLLDEVCFPAFNACIQKANAWFQS